MSNNYDDLSMVALLKHVWCWLKKITVLLIIISILMVLILRFVNPPGSMLMLEQKIMHWQSEQRHIWVDFANMSDNIKIAVIAAEDQNFAYHFGFDMQAIERAISHNQHYQSLQGASTITQQVAKNLFLWPARSLLRKAFEFWYAIWIELFWSKQRILEIYLNSVEWGNGIFGIEAAAQYYFHISAKQLSLRQASLLAAILPNPRQLDPLKPTEKILNKTIWIEQQINQLGEKNYLDHLQ